MKSHSTDVNTQDFCVGWPRWMHPPQPFHPFAYEPQPSDRLSSFPTCSLKAYSSILPVELFFSSVCNLIHIQRAILTILIKMKNTYIVLIGSLLPSSVSPVPHPRQAQFWFQSPLIYSWLLLNPYKQTHILKWNCIVYVVFCFWCLSLNIMFLRFTHTFVCISSLFFVIVA